jgi:hypothetical protein
MAPRLDPRGALRRCSRMYRRTTPQDWSRNPESGNAEIPEKVGLLPARRPGGLDSEKPDLDMTDWTSNKG